MSGKEDISPLELKNEMFKKLIPLPVTVITTVDNNGIANAAPYGCVMPILRPLDLVAIASALPRDTLRNIRDTGEFVINVIGKPGFKRAMQTAKNYPPGVNELEEVGVEVVPSKKTAPPRIKDSLGWIEAVLDEEILREKFSLIIGKVVCAEINDAFIENGKLAELPALLLMPDYRLLGDSIIGSAEETMKLFLPPS
jgi:flavin reductase (DIM6/NTAB) family NADH-FMN oxidoreductase RutF